MIVKILGALIFVFSCAGFGFCINKETKIKIKEFENFKKCIDIMKNEMCISYKTFYEALETVSKYANNFIFCELLKYSSRENSISLFDNLEDLLNSIKKSNLYNEKDICVFENINNIIGNTDISCLKNNYELLELETDNRIAQLNSDIKSKALFGKIAIYVSFIIVIFLF